MAIDADEEILQDFLIEATEILELEEALPGHTLGNGIIEPK